jgi:hypothetical protein
MNGTEPTRSTRAVCQSCGAQADQTDHALLTWVHERVDGRRSRWWCAHCIRQHLPAIEARVGRSAS